MMICPICKSQGTLLRGQVSETRQGAVYFAVCARCTSHFSVPAHEYFQLYSQQRTREVGAS